jgi:hypothetical protein
VRIKETINTFLSDGQNFFIFEIRVFVTELGIFLMSEEGEEEL